MRRYVDIWSLPGAPILLLAGFLGRLPVAMVPLALLLLVEDATGSYASAGLATASYGLATAAVAPVLGRLADRFGPRPILVVTGLAYPAALLGLLAVLRTRPSPSLLLLAAAGAGAAMPLVSSSVRALWTRVAPAGAARHSAYALDAISVECVFVLGPVLVAGLTTVTGAELPILLAALLALAGSLVVGLSGPARAWRPAAAEDGRAGSPVRSAAMRVLLGSTAAVMFGLGCLEVAIPAWADQDGRPGMSGPLLAVWALGSAAGGLWFGARRVPMSLPRQYRWALLAVAAGFAPLAAAQDPWVLGALLFVGGTAIAPTVSVQNTLVAQLAPAQATTEAFTWLTTVVFGASALGAAVGGAVVGHPAGIALTLGLATVSALVAAGVATAAGPRWALAAG